MLPIGFIIHGYHIYVKQNNSDTNMQIWYQQMKSANEELVNSYLLKQVIRPLKPANNIIGIFMTFFSVCRLTLFILVGEVRGWRLESDFTGSTLCPSNTQMFVR